MANFEKGAVIGFSEIVEEDGRNVVVDAVKVDAIPASISNVKSSNDVIVIGGSEIELDDFNTVIYTNSYNDTITKDVDGVPADSDEGRTNILYWPTPSRSSTPTRSLVRFTRITLITT